MSEPFVGNPEPHPMKTHDSKADHGPNFQAYINVFLILCVLTGVSFLVNFIMGHNQASMLIILGVAAVKATLVAMIFMHLKFDWPKLYCIVIPVCVMAVMMIIVLLPDICLGWHKYQYFYEK